MTVEQAISVQPGLAPPDMFSSRTSLRAEDALLFALPSAIPLQEAVSVGGINVGAMFFAAIIGMAYFARFWRLATVLTAKATLPVYAFLLGAFALELRHEGASLRPVLRIALMAAGAFAVAVLCRDRRALRWLLRGVIAAAAWLTVYLLVTAGPIVMGSTANDFTAASALRADISDAVGLRENLNTLAFLCAQGATVALALALAAPSARLRRSRIVSALGLAIGAALTLSRGGVLVFVTTAVVIVIAVGGRWRRRLALAACASAVVLLILPSAVTARLRAPDTYSTGAPEGRSVIFDAVVENLPEYWLTGVGAGNFERNWGASHGFVAHGDLVGAQNAFAQAMLYWGIVGLILLVFVVATLFRSVRLAPDLPARLALLALLVSAFMWLQLTHDLHAKPLAIAFGAALAVRTWHSGAAPSQLDV